MSDPPGIGEQYRFAVEQRWTEQAPAFADLIEQIVQYRPPIDCHSHEHDIRQMLSRPGSRSSIWRPSPMSMHRFGSRPSSSTPRRQLTLRGATRFELFRSRLGRRARAQVLAYDWSGSATDIDVVIDDWFSFGPSIEPIIE